MFSRTATACLSFALALAAVPAFAEDTPAPATPTLMPAMTGPLAASANPYSFELGSAGKIYVGGALTGFALSQNNHVTTDKNSRGDIGNAQLFVQKPDGLVQFFLQAGEYSVPVVGTPYIRAENYTEHTYGYIPQGFVKLAPTSNFSIMAGKLPTLFGAEYTFSFENMNVQRGLLWNQENAVNKGLQANYSTGPFALSLSWNDGFYSDKYNWLDGSVAWTIDSKNTLSFVAGGNLNSAAHTDFATPLAQNNGQIYNLIYTYNAAPWTITPYIQYTHTPQDISIGLADSASSWGAAVLGKYTFNDHWSLAGRAEYISTEGSAAGPNLLYGAGSDAWSATVTPTYQYDRFFGRADASYTRAVDAAAGAAFGSSGNDKSQVRLIFEAGVLF